MQLEKVRTYIASKNLLSPGETVVVAVSGGPDSLCLLKILHQLAADAGYMLVVAHLNHCLRPEAVDEARGVEKIASSLSLPIETRAVDIRAEKRKHGLSEEVAGRRARYKLLIDTARKYNASAIAMGHHLDDQAETVLLNILRGTGIDGLSGILPKRVFKEVRLIRPLLCLRRTEIEAFCREQGFQPFTDSSNLETYYTRNKVRLNLIPYLEQNYNPRIREALCRLAELAADDRHYLNRLANRIVKRMVHYSGDEMSIDARYLKRLHPALRGRVLRQVLKRLNKGMFYGRSQLLRLFDLVDVGKTGTEVTLPGGVRARYSYGNLLFSFAGKKKTGQMVPEKLSIPGKTRISSDLVVKAVFTDPNKLDWPSPSYRAYLDYDRLPAAAIEVRTRRAGDRFFPQGAAGSKKLKEFMIDQKVPFNKRDTVTLISCGEEILWVAGIRIAHPYRVTETTEKVLVLELRKNRPAKRQTRSRLNIEVN